MACEPITGRGRHLSAWAIRLMLYCVFLGILLVPGCSDDDQSGHNAKDRMLPLRFGLSAQPTAALSIIAVEQGFFAQAGLDVAPLRFPSGKRALREGLFKGRVDVVSPSDAPVVIAAFERDDFVILGALFKTNNINRIVVRRDRGIERPADLKGKRIGTQKGSAVHYFLHLFLSYHGMSEEDVDIIFMKAERLPNALADGEIDAFSMREPYVSLALSLLPDQAHAMAAPGLYTQMDFLVVRSDMLEEEPEIAMRLLRGLKAAEEFVESNPDEAIVTVARYIGVPSEKIRAIWPGLKLKVALDAPIIDLIEEQAQWVKQAGIAKYKDVPDFREIIKPGPLGSLWPEIVHVQ